MSFSVGFVGTGKIGVANEEALAVAVGIDEPACDVVGSPTADFLAFSDRRRPGRGSRPRFDLRPPAGYPRLAAEINE